MRLRGNGGPVDVMEAGTATNGVVGMFGNVREVTETPLGGPDGVFFASIGGAWSDRNQKAERSLFEAVGYNIELRLQGFRVASVPEPTCNSLWLVGLLFVSRRLIPNKRKTG